MPWDSSWPQEIHGEAVTRAPWGSTGQRPHPTSTDTPCLLPTRTTNHTNCQMWPHLALCHRTLSMVGTREKTPLPQHQHVPGLQGTPQAHPTCRPELPRVLQLARTSGPPNPGTELGPTYTHLPPSAQPRPLPVAAAPSSHLPFPAQARESQLGSGPALGAGRDPTRQGLPQASLLCFFAVFAKEQSSGQQP